MIALTSVVVFNSCDKTKQYDLEVAEPGQAHFNNTIGTADEYVNYYVVDDPNSTFTLSVGTTNVTSEDRSVSWKLAAPTGAVAGTHYTMVTTGNSVTIPAGQATTDIKIHGIFAPYASGLRRDTLVFTLEQPATVEIAGFSDTVKVILQKYCTPVISSYTGAWNNVLEYDVVGGPPTYGPYSVGISNVTQVSPTRSEVTITNLWDYPTSLRMTFKYADPGNHQVVIPEQYSGVNLRSGGVTYELWIRTSAGQVNTFNSCDNIITVAIDAIAKRIPSQTTAGLFAQNYGIVIRR